MNMNEAVQIGAAIIFTLFSDTQIVKAEGSAKPESVPMRLEMAFDRPACAEFENPTLQVRMIDPNDFPVTLRGFVFGYIEPQIEVRGSDGEWHRLHYGPMDSAWTDTPVTIPARGVLEHRRFLYVGFAVDRWPVEPGVFRLRPKSNLSSGRVGDQEDVTAIQWDRPIVELSVVARTARDRMAFEFMRERLSQSAEDMHKSAGDEPNVYYMRLYRRFLEQFSDTAYAPEIRWQVSILLQDELGNNRVPEQDRVQMVELWEQCLTFCLERGGAYAEEFVWWDMNRGAIMRWTSRGGTNAWIF